MDRGVGLFEAIGRYLDARRRRKAWDLVARGLALHPSIAGELVTMVTAMKSQPVHLDPGTTGAADER